MTNRLPWGDESVILSVGRNTIASMTAQWNYPPPPPAPTSVARRSRWALWVGLATAATAIAVGGGIVGAAVTASRTEPSNPDTAASTTMTTAAADTHAQDVALCTKYAIINGAMPYKDNSAGDLLPAVTAMENALRDNPAASPAIRKAITDMVAAYYGRMAAYEPLKPAGLSEPPPHSVAAEQAASDKVWAACGLDK